MTKAQKLASDPGASVWVAASAGTGKTKVLTDRVLRLLLGGAKPASILCITFTKAAASEMSNRIYAELSRWVTLGEIELCKRLGELTDSAVSDEVLLIAKRLFVEVLDTPEGLKIQTIHAFCQGLLNRFPLEAGIAPNFTVIDEQTSLELLKEARSRLLVSKNEDDESNEVKDAIEEIACFVYEGSLNGLIAELMQERGRLVDIFNEYDSEGAKKAVYESLGLVYGDSEQESLEDACGDGSFDVVGLKDAASALSSGSPGDADRAAVIFDYLAYDPKIRAQKFTAYRKLFIKADGEAKSLKSVITLKTQQSNTSAAICLEKEQERLLRLDDRLKSLRVAKFTSNLLIIAYRILENYTALKDKQSFLDYDDLIGFSCRLLSVSHNAPWILYKLDGGLEHILVDEAQDTSPDQWKVIAALCEEFFSGDSAGSVDRTLFVVGDEKQSIYSFQGADPKAFQFMHELFASKCEYVGKAWRSIALDLSFRSTAPVLDFVDRVFSKDGLKDAITQMEHRVLHNAFRSKDAGRVEVWPLTEPEDKKELEVWPLPITMEKPHDQRLKLASEIAAKVKSWISQKRVLQAKGRPVRPGDVLILVRRRNVFVDYLVRELKQSGIAVSGIDRLSISDSLAVMDLVALGSFLLCPDDDLTLATVLKSPFIGFDEDELFDLAHDRGDKSLWRQLKLKAEGNVNYNDAVSYLRALMGKTDFLGPYDLYLHILETLDGRKQLASRLGAEVNEPVDGFLSLASLYESSHIKTLQGFLDWFAAGDVTIKRDLDQGQDEVRIMTVHGSKGLQAPIVFLADTTSLPESNVNSSKICWSGSELPLPLWSAGRDNENELIKNIKEENRRAEYNEYLRLLYVALTRAEDELYICGWKNKTKISDRCWYQLALDSLKEYGKEEDGVVYYENEVWPVEVREEVESEAGDEEVLLPEFLTEVFDSKAPKAKAITPSYHDDGAVFDEDGVKLGVLIHKLLECLPDNPIADRENIIDNLLLAEGLDENQALDIKGKVLRVLGNDDLFGGDSQAEVSVVGEVRGSSVLGVIDRLVVKDDEVIVVDYKTDKAPSKDIDNVPVAYLKQVALYSDIVAAMYEGKRVRACIVWVNDNNLMFFDREVLEKYLP